jgi:PKD repeat protein
MIIMNLKTMKQKSGMHSLLLAFCIALIAILVLPAIVSADDYVGGVPLTTVQTGTVTGDLWFDATPPDFSYGAGLNQVKTFTLPENAVGNITWARLYVSAYCGHMQDDKAFTMTNRFDGNGDGTYENVWPETGHAAFVYIKDKGNDNSGFTGHSTGEPYKMINDHETRVTSDYLAYYDVTNLISNRTVFTNVVTTGSYDGRIKVITLVVAYNDPSSTTQTTYWVNQGHDVCSYYTEDNSNEAAVGTTTFNTAGLSSLTSATLTADYMASNNGNYGFPTSTNSFTYTGGTPPVTGDFTNLPLDRVADVQGAYSGVDSWDVTSSVTGASDVTFAYSRYFPGTGTAAFYKIPLAILVVKKPAPAIAPVAQFASDTRTGTAPLNITFTDQSSNTPTSWAWNFGDTGTSTEQNPVHQYTTAGNYTVTLIATNAGGSGTEIKTDYITVSPAVTAPVAAFSGAPTSGIAPLTVTFTDQSSNTPTSWAWTFGDSSSTNATVKNPVHTYASAGTYTVTLTATNAGGSNSTTKANYITATTAPTFNLTFTGANGAATVNPYPAYIFAWEPNTVQVKTIKNIGTGTATNIVVALYASDVSSTVPVNTTTIASLAAGSTAATQTIIDPTIRTTQGASVTYTAVIDPGNLIPETNETDNTRTSAAKSVIYNGYKGKGIYWAGGSNGGNITTKKTYDLHGGVLYYTQPDSAYKGVGWTTRTESWSSSDLPLPAGATVEQVWLYLSYNWDHTLSTADTLPNMAATFNGNSLTLGTPYTDRSNFGAYVNYTYGLYPIDVTSLFSTSGNTLNMTAGAGNQNALYPSTLTVIYRDANETRKQIFINEECDELGVSPSSYGTTSDEAIAYAPFSGMTIDTANVQSATLDSFAGSAGPTEGNLLFNGQTVATLAWRGNADTASAQSFDVKNYLTATGNEAGIQGTESGGMDALQQILVVEYTSTAPVAAFSGTPTSGTAPLTVTFTDASTNAPTSWLWDFGDGSSTNATVQNPVHTYAAAGTYTVKLTATNSAGSNTATQTSYITVSPSVIAPVAAFSGTPTSGTAPLTVTFTDASTNAPTSWLWDFGDGSSTNATVQNPVHTYASAGTYTVNLTVTNSAGSNTVTQTSYITVSPAVIAFPGNTNPPKDLNSDGLYEDMNGNNRKDVGDVVLFIDNIVWVGANEPIAAFDFNGNGRIDVGDVIVLLDSMSG